MLGALTCDTLLPAGCSCCAKRTSGGSRAGMLLPPGLPRGVSSRRLGGPAQEECQGAADCSEC